MIHEIEYTDTYGGHANYSWVNRDTVSMPELTHYGYDGYSNYSKCNRVYERELMKKAKACLGLTGVRGRVERFGYMIAFYPYNMCTVMFITEKEE